MSEYQIRINEISILVEGKWPQWSRKVRVALRSNRTWTYIEGPSSMEPTSSAEIKDWHVVNDLIVAALCGIIDDMLLQELEKLTTVKTEW